jgi:hypothetical protein
VVGASGLLGIKRDMEVLDVFIAGNGVRVSSSFISLMPTVL